MWELNLEYDWGLVHLFFFLVVSLATLSYIKMVKTYITAISQTAFYINVSTEAELLQASLLLLLNSVLYSPFFPISLISCFACQFPSP